MKRTVKTVLFSLALYLIAMILVSSISWLFGTIDTKKQTPISANSSSDSDITQPKTVEVKRSEEETESNEKQIETADSSESVASPFDFQVNIIPAENHLKSNKDVMYFTEPRYISREILYELKRRKVKICRKPRRWTYDFIGYEKESSCPHRRTESRK